MVPEIRTIVDLATSQSRCRGDHQMMMLSFRGIILLATKTDPRDVPNGVVFKLVWRQQLLSSVSLGCRYLLPIRNAQFKSGIVEMVTNYPWTFASSAIHSIGCGELASRYCTYDATCWSWIRLDPALLIGLMPAVYGYFFIPNHPSDIATVNFDVSGTTKIGKWYFQPLVHVGRFNRCGRCMLSRATHWLRFLSLNLAFGRLIKLAITR